MSSPSHASPSEFCREARHHLGRHERDAIGVGVEAAIDDTRAKYFTFVPNTRHAMMLFVGQLMGRVVGTELVKFADYTPQQYERIQDVMERCGWRVTMEQIDAATYTIHMRLLDAGSELQSPGAA